MLDGCPKVSVAHLIPAPFTMQAAKAMEEMGALCDFYCTLVDQPEVSWQKIAKKAAKVIRFDLEGNLKRRSVSELCTEKVKAYPFREATRMLFSRLIKDPVWGDRIFHWGRNGFDNWVARNLEGVDVIYGYEYGVLKTFEVAKRHGIKTVYDTPSPEHDFVERILAPEFDRFPELVTPYRRMVKENQAARTERRRNEWELSDLVVANSSFTAESWKSAGWESKSVSVIPYGAPPVVGSADRQGSSKKIRFLWAGSFSIRKGAHYLIEAVRMLSSRERSGFTIDVYGAVTLPEALLEGIPSEIRFQGSVPRQQLFEEMSRSDLLVFPTLCDGFGLVVNEAFARGLPVLTTGRAGASDLIVEGENGWLIEAGNSTALKEEIQRALDNREKLKSMRINAQRTAKKWQWQDYRKEICSAVKTLMKVK